ncbi:hypothetical protein P3102_19020 [Amycolatopsis sp. QT-25]|uniref:hypothetical protein n=1 Tax=Amycolatopsis sp. QT-25 TaxID=3034022 RepID=UPI0023EDB7AB|nr:hypothetical protein [Amycolatopsis sp. QT-25]WET76228.1 hypothetical protein P3102_19020 [Amycolatopsis sp. QT-25]
MSETTRRNLLRFTAAAAVAGAAGAASGYVARSEAATGPNLPAAEGPERAFLAQSPDAIRGLKWRGAQLTPPPNPTLTARFDTRGLPYATAAFSLANNNLDTVALRVANMGDLPDGTTRQQRDDEVIKLLRELHRQGIKTYLFKRQWFQRSGVIISYERPFTEAGADEFIDDMSRLINRARQEGIAGALHGVAAIETNLNNCAELRERALYVARGINGRTDNWLRSRTLLMPGAGMGPYFKGIHNGGEAWLTQLRAQTGYFALIYKHMRSQENGLCRLESLNGQWDQAVGWDAAKTPEQQIAFLRTTMGISDLEWYFRTHRAEYPNHTHVVFWGDQGDGVAGLSARDGQPQWNYNTLRALHRLLVKANRWHGHFFNFPFTREGATKHDLWRYLITVAGDGSNTRRKNWEWNRSRTHRVWDEWHMWPQETAAY